MKVQILLWSMLLPLWFWGQSKIEQFQKKHPENHQKSKAVGAVSKGQLINGKLVSFKGKNYQYFDTTSYLNARGFTHHLVKTTIEQAYAQCEKSCPNYSFVLMECSNQKGGKIWPHRTHQNGLSIDFAMPLMKDSVQCKKFDFIGAKHYLLDFNNKGQYSKDTTISIQFEMVARHLLELEKAAHKNGLKISKVILKTELKDDLYRTPSGKILKQKGIYVVKRLEPLINRLHDDHYHVDFALR